MKTRSAMVERAYRQTKNLQDAEDIVQQTALNMLDKPNVTNRRAYASQSVRNAAYNRYRNVKRSEKALDKYRQTRTDEQRYSVQPTVDPHGYQRLYVAVGQLPKGQQAVIAGLLTGADLADLPGNRDTNKSHYRWAVQKLRKMFKVEK